jgi:hypothetical protein
MKIVENKRQRHYNKTIKSNQKEQRQKNIENNRHKNRHKDKIRLNKNEANK